MNHWKYTWFKAGVLTLILGLLCIGVLTLLTHLNILQMVEYGRQTFVGMIYFALTWIAMLPIIIVSFSQFSGIAGVFGILAIILGILLNIGSLFGIGAVFGWLLGHDSYR